jgi:hypothetical protein
MFVVFMPLYIFFCIDGCCCILFCKYESFRVQIYFEFKLVSIYKKICKIKRAFFYLLAEWAET